jgi:hypothetical protein
MSVMPSDIEDTDQDGREEQCFDSSTSFFLSLSFPHPPLPSEDPEKNFFSLPALQVPQTPCII